VTELPIEEQMTDTAGYIVMWTFSELGHARSSVSQRGPWTCGHGGTDADVL